MGFSVFYTIIVVLCADVLAKSNDKAKDVADQKKPMHTAENWMIYGPILVAILLILSCVFSCKLRNWYRHNQVKTMLRAAEEKERQVVVAIIPEANDPDPQKEDSYRLLTPDYRPQTPQTPGTQTNSLPVRSGSYHLKTASLPRSHTGSYRHPSSLTSHNRPYLLVTDSGNVSRSTTLTRDEIV